MLALAAAVLLALAHLLAGKLRFLDRAPRRIWRSIAGGVSVAYVFVHLLPELSEGQETVAEAAGEALAFVENHVYLVSLFGLAVFYGLEHTPAPSRKSRKGAGEEDTTSPGVFWLNMASFSLYNVLIGYLLLHRIERSPEDLILFATAILLHFVVNDYGLREHHKRDYSEIGRWILGSAVLLGWVIGLAVEVPEEAIAVIIAFLAGGIVLNVLKEELPAERESRYWAFVLQRVS